MAEGGKITNPHVVIVGGGYGGSVVAMAMKKKNVNYTLIDARPALHHCLAAVRATVVKDFAKQTLIPFGPTFGDHFKLGKMTGVDPGEKTVHVEGGDSVRFDILVLATGSSSPFPGKLSVEEKTMKDMLQRYDGYTDKVKSSEKIVLVGGGAVGVEIAGEIATEYPDKEVTLIHSSSRLARPGLTDGFQNRLKEIIAKLNIKVIYDETVSNLDDIPDMEAATVHTNNGMTIEADLVIKCTGLRINSEGYSEGLAEVMNDKGALQVNEFLQVTGNDDIFSLGDCCASGAAWMAYHAGEQAKVVIENIKRMTKGSKLKPYKIGANNKGGLLVLSVGRSNAIGQMAGGRRLPEFILKKVKSSGLFVGKYWGQMNQKPPSVETKIKDHHHTETTVHPEEKEPDE